MNGVMGQLDDTICAVATPRGEGGIGVVRMSGEQAIPIASRVVILRSGCSLDQIPSHKLCLGDVFRHRDMPTVSQGNKGTVLLDEVLAVAMKAPHSYTGEDVVEIHCHGGSLVVHEICQALASEGARLAEPGEFTKRAFLNGRMDLSQAEAVLDTIQATTVTSLQVAQGQLRGGLSKRVEDIRQELIKALAHLEAGMDFVEEDIQCFEWDEMEATLRATFQKISRFLDRFEEGRILREGILAAIIGRPNVGKSSLLNALVQHDRAMVSSIPGTTRDIIEEWINVEGIPFRLVDTAGFRTPEGLLEEEGIRRAKEMVALADLVFIVVDGSEELTDQDKSLIQEQDQKKCVVILNKVDLPLRISLVELDSLLTLGSLHPSCLPPRKIVKLSAKTGQGMDDLRRAIHDMCQVGQLESSDSVLITKLRHKILLEQAREALGKSLSSVEQKMAGECIALDLRSAIESLGEITGEVSTDDVLDRIFKEFCIGK